MIDITFIIPAYGEADLVERSVGSIAGQWLAKEGVHIILVNDCSPNVSDGYNSLKERYEHRVKSFTILQTEKNSGQGIARQTGIDACQTEYFAFCDEDDMYAPIAYYVFSDAIESNKYQRDQYGKWLKDSKGDYIIREDYIPAAVVAAAVEQTSPECMCQIPPENDLWVQSHLFNKKFLVEHDIRFLEPSSRHSEDYQWSSMVFPSIGFDDNWTGLLVDSSRQMFYWLDNPNSQSRKDPFYGEMLSGYTCRSSTIILNYYENCEKHNLKQTDAIKKFFLGKLVNSTAYNYFALYNFIYKVIKEGYVPALEQDWTILRDSVSDLCKMMREYWDEYTYTARAEQIYACKNLSDCRTEGFEPMVDFDTFCQKGDIVLDWSFEDLINAKDEWYITDKGIFKRK